MEVAAELGMPRPHLAVSKRELYESAEARAPWTEYFDLYDRIHIVDDYRDQDALIDAAVRHGLDGIYVGYGYNAEDAEFIARCEEAGLVPISPSSSVMAFSGSKFRAKRLVGKKLGIPVLPGTDRAAEMALEQGVTDERLIQAVTEEVEALLGGNASRLLRLKAAKSGGGKGQRLVADPARAAGAVKEIWAEVGARGVDGDKGILVEANLEHPRHWEIQILSDGETVVHFGGRECSIQNSGSQKFVELSLHPGQYDAYLQSLDSAKDAGLIEAIREEQARIDQTCASAVEIMRSLDYRGAGTVEFLVAEEGGSDVLGIPHFMEINSRIQVEHRVSEAIARVRGRRVRLVGEQFRIAAGEKLGYTQDDIAFEGYAIENRINASDSNFLIGASGSVIERYRHPPASIDFTYDDGGAAALFASGRRRSWAIPNFDSNFGLAVFRGSTQAEALANAESTLEDFEIQGNERLRTTRAFHLGVLALLRDSPPHGKIRTDFAEIFLAFGAMIHSSLAKVEPSATSPDDPLHDFFLAALEAFQADPGLAIAFACRERRLNTKAREAKKGLASDVLTAMARLVQFPLSALQDDAIQAFEGEYPPLVSEILSAVEASGALEFRRNAGDLEFSIPDGVKDSKARRLLIEELRDAALSSLSARSLGASELDELKQIFKALEDKTGRLVKDAELSSRLNRGVAHCVARVENNSHMSPPEFSAFYDDLRSVKWTIRRGNPGEAVEAALMTEVNRALRLIRGPNVVAPLAGTIYLRPAPGKPHFVKLGDEVVEDETVVALIENMKMFNEIRAHMSGRVKEIRVENERPVLPGEVILVIE